MDAGMDAGMDIGMDIGMDAGMVSSKSDEEPIEDLGVPPMPGDINSGQDDEHDQLTSECEDGDVYDAAGNDDPLREVDAGSDSTEVRNPDDRGCYQYPENEANAVQKEQYVLTTVYCHLTAL
jgi:hypothetical protein